MNTASAGQLASESLEHKKVPIQYTPDAATNTTFDARIHNRTNPSLRQSDPNNNTLSPINVSDINEFSAPKLVVRKGLKTAARPRRYRKKASIATAYLKQSAPIITQCMTGRNKRRKESLTNEWNTMSK